MKILIIRFSSIGDIVLTTPVIRCLKNQLPDVEIHFLTKKKFEILIESNPFIDKKIYLENSLQKLISQLNEEKYDLIIDLHKNLRSLIIKLDLGVPTRSFRKINFLKFLAVLFRSKKILPKKHIVERYMKTVKHLKVTNDGMGLDYFIPQKDTLQIKDLPLTHVHGFVAIAIGAQHFTKKLPIKRIKELCEKLDVPVVLLGGNEDRANAEEIRKGLEIKVYNACGIYNLNQSASMLNLSKKVIAHDTGLMHIAAALKKEIISVWGNTIPEFGMSPYFGEKNLPLQNAKNSTMMEVKNLSCRPCSKLGKQKCPEGHFNCMNQINLDKVAELVSR